MSITTDEAVEIWVVMWSYDWEEGSRVFMTEGEANDFACRELFKVDSSDEITDAYEEGKWKAFGIHPHTIKGVMNMNREKAIPFVSFVVDDAGSARRLNEDMYAIVREFGEQCLRETEWLAQRGLDDSFLPEVDGETNYSVLTEESPGSFESRGCRHYE